MGPILLSVQRPPDVCFLTGAEEVFIVIQRGLHYIVYGSFLVSTMLRFRTRAGIFSERVCILSARVDILSARVGILSARVGILRAGVDI